MGPFALDPGIAIDAGERIALVPINGDDTPIEQGVIGQDGIRYFPANAFSGGLGSSASFDPGSRMDNGQVVPIQATVQYTPVVAPSDGSPPHYTWYTSAHAGTPLLQWRVVGRAPSLRITAVEEGQYLHCDVRASNTAGFTNALSNTYLVPQHAPVAQGPVHVRILVPTEPVARQLDPSTTLGDPLPEDVHWRQELECETPRFDRPDALISYDWRVSGTGIFAPAYVDMAGPVLRIDTWRAPITVSTLSGASVLASDQPLWLDGSPALVQCTVTAGLSGVRTVVASQQFYLDVHIAPPGTANPYPSL